ncbi:MAG: sugar phosphate isomerase/epimerase [Verrucomicrobia bacterium]|nr:sugar phosphate isomerase/epimerase [Verrucomicrobiota bacterium]
MIPQITRREFLSHTTSLAAGAGLASALGCASLRTARKPLFEISIAEWSLHRALFDGKINHVDFPRTAKNDYGINAIELVNQFFKDKASDRSYLTDFKKRADDLGVRILLIMCDGEGALGDPNASGRNQAVENHYKWLEAAHFFGCHSIRVNADARGAGSFEEQQKRAADGLRRLSEEGARHGLNVIVENHGGLSSNATWLSGVMRMVNLPNCGTLPDFGNFYDYDRYQGVSEMMPFAKAVSAKALNFDEHGNCVETDYRRMIQIVLQAGYHGYMGIEYEGEKLSEPEGIRKTKHLLETVRSELS